jgi:hypothetical protein
MRQMREISMVELLGKIQMQKMRIRGLNQAGAVYPKLGGESVNEEQKKVLMRTIKWLIAFDVLLLIAIGAWAIFT